MPTLDVGCKFASPRPSRGDRPSHEERVDVRMADAEVVHAADQGLAALHERFQQTDDPALRDEIANEALDLVERQLAVARDRRARLDSFEGSLWARRNRIERFLIRTRGRAWWQARRNGGREPVAG
jgi:hypothetical protein